MAARNRGRGEGPQERRRRGKPKLQWGERLAGKLKAVDPRNARAVHAVLDEAGLWWDARAVSTLLKELRNARANLEVSFQVVDWCRRCKGIESDVYTYSALISACEKAGQSDRAFGVYADMRRERVTPNVYMYSALISACEKAGESDRAFEVYADMRREGVAPDVYAYNALISACEKAGQSDRAFGVYDEMRREGVEPTVITYNALISACAYVGQWRRALVVSDKDMPHAGVHPDRVSHTSLQDALWAGRQYGKCAVRMGKLTDAGDAAAGCERKALLDLHDLSPGAACCRVLLWLDEKKDAMSELSSVVIVTGKGLSRQAHQTSDSVVRAAVTTMLDALESPFAQPPDNAGCLEARAAAVAEWLSAVDVRSLLVDDADHPALSRAGRAAAPVALRAGRV